MLSLGRCRELVGKDCRLSDEELKLLAQQLYGLAHVALDGLGATKNPPSKPDQPEAGKFVQPNGTEHEPSFADVLALLPEDDRYAVEERAAIHEFDGGCTRQQAEKLALDAYWASKLTGGTNEH